MDGAAPLSETEGYGKAQFEVDVPEGIDQLMFYSTEDGSDYHVEYVEATNPNGCESKDAKKTSGDEEEVDESEEETDESEDEEETDESEEDEEERTPPVAQCGTHAFPTAEGFGANAIGGRGGRPIFVTSLDGGTGPGTFGACLLAEGPRTCIFRVGGIIDWPASPATALFRPILPLPGKPRLEMEL